MRGLTDEEREALVFAGDRHECGDTEVPSSMNRTMISLWLRGLISAGQCADHVGLCRSPLGTRALTYDTAARSLTSEAAS